jgi:hypothetical protein
MLLARRSALLEEPEGNRDWLLVTPVAWCLSLFPGLYLMRR